MKKLAIFSAALGLLGLAFALYLHFVIAQNAYIAESDIQHAQNYFGDDSLAYYDTIEYKNNFTKIELKTDMGIISLLIGAVIFIIGVLPVVKKEKLGWIGVLGGLAALVMGAAYGTHMFS
jgi:uncharacterized membrane protein YkgB